MLNAFVTVGSTKFDALIHQILSQPVLEALASKGYKTLVVQCGNSQLPNEDETEYTSHGVSINLWRFKTSLQEEYEKADLVISHAGSGTILNVLRMRKPLIVVPNTTLLDDHQQELAEALSVLGHLVAADISGLPRAIATLDPSSFVSFPAFDRSKFGRILDEEMGFA